MNTISFNIYIVKPNVLRFEILEMTLTYNEYVFKRNYDLVEDFWYEKILDYNKKSIEILENKDLISPENAKKNQEYQNDLETIYSLKNLYSYTFQNKIIANHQSNDMIIPFSI